LAAAVQRRQRRLRGRSSPAGRLRLRGDAPEQDAPEQGTRMTDIASRPALDLDAIARPGGGLAMVAMDQRESLRHMFDLAGAGRPADDILIRFKLDVAEALGPLASGFLIDRHFGFEAARDVLPDS